MDMPICIPGMQVEKESSDSDPEAVAARKQRRSERFAKEARERQEAERAEQQKSKLNEELADKELLLQELLGKTDREVVLGQLPEGRPEALEERMKLASQLREDGNTCFKASQKGSEHSVATGGQERGGGVCKEMQGDQAEPCKESAVKSSESNLEEAVMKWLAAIHCLDFTSRQLTAMSEGERVKVFENVTLVLSNLSLGRRKLRSPVQAIRAADLGIEVAMKIPYESSKAHRVKLRLRRALARGDRRDFEGAGEDARHVLDISPDEDEAKLIARNAELAMRRENGPPAKRWTGPLNIHLERKAPPRQKLSPSIVLIVSCVIAVALILWLALTWARAMAGSAERRLPRWEPAPVCSTSCGATAVDDHDLVGGALPEWKCAHCEWAWSFWSNCSDEPAAVVELKTNGTCTSHGCSRLQSSKDCVAAARNLNLSAKLQRPNIVQELLGSLLGTGVLPGCRLRERPKGGQGHQKQLAFSQEPERDTLLATEKDAVLCSCPGPQTLARKFLQKACCTLHPCIQA
eukprot:TRINITY_DN24070_c0_g1_i1.p1 TRINITY_DN24070_c0_g1~~TRINITY_DN24070_c0_g1_i1.p1  ORF type:complete len:521 (+),score=112.41 TRINITY_DN24070_c0_g1_i1:60-1622(+)